jgi:hypothetical protein
VAASTRSFSNSAATAAGQQCEGRGVGGGAGRACTSSTQKGAPQQQKGHP